MRGWLKLALILTVFTACSDNAAKEQSTLQELMALQQLTADELSLLIDKSDRLLYVQAANKKLKTYPVVFGPEPVKDKRMEGDKCTPEGDFGVRDMYPHKAWSKFIWVDYPNEESWAKHKASKQAGEIPASATIGGEIGIHGVPDGRDDLIDKQIDWTLGCISMKNADVDELYESISRKTRIVIQP